MEANYEIGRRHLHTKLKWEAFLNSGFIAYLRLQKSKREFKWAENSLKKQKFIWDILKHLDLRVNACETCLGLQAVQAAVLSNCLTCPQNHKLSLNPTSSIL